MPNKEDEDTAVGADVAEKQPNKGRLEGGKGSEALVEDAQNKLEQVTLASQDQSSTQVEALTATPPEIDSSESRQEQLSAHHPPSFPSDQPAGLPTHPHSEPSPPLGATSITEQDAVVDEGLSPQDPQAKLVVTFQVDNAFVGLLIGKGGDTIRGIGERSKAQVSLTRDQHYDVRLQTRTLTLSGTNEEIGVAVDIICQLLDAGWSKNSPTPSSPPPFDTMVISVPNQLVGLLIGKGGISIRDLQQEIAPATVSLARESHPGLECRDITLRGLPSQIVRAQIAIFKSLSRGPMLPAGPMGIIQPSQSVQKTVVAIPNEKVGLLIGKGGSTLREIMETTKAKVEVPRVGKVPCKFEPRLLNENAHFHLNVAEINPHPLNTSHQGSATREVAVSGSQAQVALAISTIQQRLNLPIQQQINSPAPVQMNQFHQASAMAPMYSSHNAMLHAQYHQYQQMQQQYAPSGPVPGDGVGFRALPVAQTQGSGLSTNALATNQLDLDMLQRSGAMGFAQRGNVGSSRSTDAQIPPNMGMMGTAVQKTISLPSDKLGLLLGKNGRTFRYIQETSGANLSLVPDPTQAATTRQIVVSGLDRRVAYAVGLIRQLIPPTPSPNPAAPFGTSDGSIGPVQ